MFSPPSSLLVFFFPSFVMVPFGVEPLPPTRHLATSLLLILFRFSFLRFFFVSSSSTVPLFSCLQPVISPTAVHISHMFAFFSDFPPCWTQVEEVLCFLSRISVPSPGFFPFLFDSLGDPRLYVSQAPGAQKRVSTCGSILGPFWVHVGSMSGPCRVHVGSIVWILMHL